MRDKSFLLIELSILVQSLLFWLLLDGSSPSTLLFLDLLYTFLLFWGDTSTQLIYICDFIVFSIYCLCFWFLIKKKNLLLKKKKKLTLLYARIVFAAL
jgi:phosphotransferase system  glucose/maltose/N-acetylglucosamine-specific IIC component